MCIMQVDSVANVYLCNERNCVSTEPTVVNSYNSPAVAKTYTANISWIRWSLCHMERLNSDLLSYNVLY